MEQLRVLDGKIRELCSQRDALRKESYQWTKQRDELHAAVKSLRTVAENDRKTRDELNSKVKYLKLKRDEFRNLLTGKKETSVSLRTSISSLKERVNDDEHQTEKRIKQLDWELQTNPWKGASEKEIIKQIALLERQLIVHKTIDGKQKKLTDAMAENGTVRFEIKRITEEVTQLVQESQKTHEEMKQAYDQIEKLRSQADEKHEGFVKIKIQADESHKKIMELIAEKKTLEAQIREHRIATEAERAKVIAGKQQQLLDEAAKKLKEGQKLNVHEFRILVENGKI